MPPRTLQCQSYTCKTYVQTKERSLKHVRSLGGIELMSEEVVDVMVLTEGGPVRPHMSMFRTASVWLTQADGSIGRTGSCRGIVR